MPGKKYNLEYKGKKMTKNSVIEVVIPNLFKDGMIPISIETEIW